MNTLQVRLLREKFFASGMMNKLDIQISTGKSSYALSFTVHMHNIFATKILKIILSSVKIVDGFQGSEKGKSIRLFVNYSTKNCISIHINLYHQKI